VGLHSAHRHLQIGGNIASANREAAADMPFGLPIGTRHLFRGVIDHPKEDPNRDANAFAMLENAIADGDDVRGLLWHPA
jgi:hypothetical protein